MKSISLFEKLDDLQKKNHLTEKEVKRIRSAFECAEWIIETEQSDYEEYCANEGHDVNDTDVHHIFLTALRSFGEKYQG